MKSLADVMGASGLSSYAIVALVLFFAAFILVLVRIFAPSRRKEYERDSRMPLDDDHPQNPRAP